MAKFNLKLTEFPFAGLHSALFAGSEDDTEKMLTVDATVQYWLAHGCPKEKLILGISTYGRSFTLADESQTGVGAPASGVGLKGDFTPGEVGVLSYREICSKSWRNFWDVKRMTPYVVNGNQWVGFDDTESVAIKLKYVVENDLGGAVFWSLEADDFGKLSY